MSCRNVPTHDTCRHMPHADTCRRMPTCVADTCRHMPTHALCRQWLVKMSHVACRMSHVACRMSHISCLDSRAHLTCHHLTCHHLTCLDSTHNRLVRLVAPSLQGLRFRFIHVRYWSVSFESILLSVSSRVSCVCFPFHCMVSRVSRLLSCPLLLSSLSALSLSPLSLSALSLSALSFVLPPSHTLPMAWHAGGVRGIASSGVRGIASRASHCERYCKPCVASGVLQVWWHVRCIANVVVYCKSRGVLQVTWCIANLVVWRRVCFEGVVECALRV